MRFIKHRPVGVQHCDYQFAEGRGTRHVAQYWRGLCPAVDERGLIMMMNTYDVSMFLPSMLCLHQAMGRETAAADAGARAGRRRPLPRRRARAGRPHPRRDRAATGPAGRGQHTRQTRGLSLTFEFIE